MRYTREDGKRSVCMLSPHPRPTVLDGMKYVREMALARRSQPPTMAELQRIFLP